MFNRISKRYDAVNRVLAFGMDVGWRRRVARKVDEANSEHVLDVATGTGDLLIEIARVNRTVRIVGIDPAEMMLEIARKKIATAVLLDRAELVLGSAEALPFPDASFDAVTIAFGIRNAANMEIALREMRRVLKPRGALVVLEFSTPTNPIIRFGWRVYLRYLLPVIGGAISGNFGAYRYLNRTIESFPSGPAFLQRLQDAGFTDATAKSLCLGAVSIYSGRRPVNT